MGNPNQRLHGRAPLGVGATYPWDGRQHCLAQDAKAVAKKSVNPAETGEQNTKISRKKTGRGKIKTLSSCGNQFSIYNFDINGHALKQEHKNFLAKKILQCKDVGYVLLRGLTSRSGSIKYNRALAARRVESAKKYMIAAGISETIDVAGEKVNRFLCPDIIGEEHGLGLGREDEKHRAVWIMLVDKSSTPIQAPAPIKRPVPKLIAKANQFQIRVIDGWDLSIGPGIIASYTIELNLEVAAVKDGKRAESRIYRYSGKGFIIPGGISISALEKGDWSSVFKTKTGVEIDELGPAIMSASLRLETFEKAGESAHKYVILSVKKSASDLKFKAKHIDLGSAFRPSYFITEGHFYMK